MRHPLDLVLLRLVTEEERVPRLLERTDLLRTPRLRGRRERLRNVALRELLQEVQLEPQVSVRGQEDRFQRRLTVGGVRDLTGRDVDDVLGGQPVPRQTLVVLHVGRCRRFGAVPPVVELRGQGGAVDDS